MRLRANLVLVLVAILWGSAFAAQRAAGQLGSVYFFNGARFLLAALLLLPLARKVRIGREQIGWGCIAGGILFVGSALQQAGLTTTTAGNAGFLTSLYVVIVPFVLFLGWRERPHPVSAMSFLLAAFGAYLLSTGGSMHFLAGDLLELGGAVFWAMHVILLGKFGARYDAISFSAIQLFTGSALNWIASGVHEVVTLDLASRLLFPIAYTAVLSIGLGYTLQIWAQKHSPPSDAALILSMESVFAALSGALILDERLSGVQMVGCAVILLAVVLSQLRGWSRIAVPGQPG